MYGATTGTKKSKHISNYTTKVPELQTKPISIHKLETLTKFTKRELQVLYQGFKQACPTGIANKDTFIDVYQGFFPNRSSSAYAQLCFRVFDKSKAGGLTFEQFACCLSQLTKGTELDKIEWIFTLYDINEDGFISRTEMKEVVQAIYELLGGKYFPGNAIKAIEDRVNTMFVKYDLNGDGQISREEFFNVSIQDPDFMRNLNIFNTIT